MEAKNLEAKNLVNYRRKMWLLLSTGFLIGFFHRYSTGVISDILAEELSLTAVNLGTLTSMYFYAYGFLQAPVGILGDKYGVRKVTFTGMIFMSAGSLLFGLSRSMLSASTGRLLIGVGSACFFISILKMIAIWFPEEKFTRYNGWTSVMGNVGALLAASPFSLLISNISWRTAYLILSGITIFLAVLIWSYVRDYPQEMGYDNINNIEADRRSFIEILQGMKVLVTDIQFWLYFIIIFVMMGSVMSLSGLWIIPFMMHVYGLTRTMAANFALVLTTGLIACSALLGWFERKIGNRVKMIRFSVFFISLIWLYIIFFKGGRPPLFQLIILLFLIGLFGLFVMVTYGSVKNLYPELKGSSMGLLNLAPFLGTVFFNFLLGWRLDATWQGKILKGSRIYTLQGYRQGFIIIFSLLIIILFLTLQLNTDDSIK